MNQALQVQPRAPGQSHSTYPLMSEMGHGARNYHPPTYETAVDDNYPQMPKTGAPNKYPQVHNY